LKARLTKYGLCALFVAVMAYFYLLSRGFAGAGNRERYQLLCDALTVPGVLLVCAGALVWVSNLGALDGIFYGLRLAFRALIPGKRLQKEENYQDFVAGRQEKRVKGYGFLLITGAVTIAASLIFLGLYYL
jgi:hypothetical protein